MIKKFILSLLLIFFLNPISTFAVPINSDVALTPFNPKFALKAPYRRKRIHKKVQCKFCRRPPLAGLTPPAATSCGVAARRADFAIAKSGFKGQTIIRSQAKWTRKTNDPTDQDRVMQIWMFPTTFVYGLTERLAFSLTAPYIDKEQKSTSAGISSTISDSGIGDIGLLSKYRIWSKDLPGEARRISLIGGLELPTGDDNAQLKLGSGSVDPIAGILWTNQSLSQEFDLDLTYQFNTKASSYEFGDLFKYNISYQHRVWPWILPEKGIYSQVNLVLELNGEYAQKDKSNEDIVKDSGGNTLFLSPGLQLAAKRWVLETSLQLPIVQDLNGGQIDTDYTIVTSLRLTY